MIFFRLLDAKDPAQQLADAVHALAQGAATRDTYTVDPVSFRHVPNAPFAYWVSENIRRIFTSAPRFENSRSRLACITNEVSDDTRYYRATWEVRNQSIGKTKKWVPLAKGGEYSPYYSDIYLVVDWDNNKNTYHGFLGTKNRPLTRPASLNHFFRPGLTWPRRTGKFGVRVLPADCIFSNKGPGIFVSEDPADELLSLLAIFSSNALSVLISLSLNAGDKNAKSFEVGIIQKLPMSRFSKCDKSQLSVFAKKCWSAKRRPDTANANSHAFVAPALTPGRINAALSN